MAVEAPSNRVRQFPPSLGGYLFSRSSSCTLAPLSSSSPSFLPPFFFLLSFHIFAPTIDFNYFSAGRIFMAAFAIKFKSQNSRTRDRRWSAENLVIWIIVTALSFSPFLRVYFSRRWRTRSLLLIVRVISVSRRRDGFGDGDKWLRRFLFLLGFEGLQD